MLMDNLERMREDGANSAKKAEEEISSIKYACTPYLLADQHATGYITYLIA